MLLFFNYFLIKIQRIYIFYYSFSIFQFQIDLCKKWIYTSKWIESRIRLLPLTWKIKDVSPPPPLDRGKTIHPRKNRGISAEMDAKDRTISDQIHLSHPSFLAGLKSTSALLQSDYPARPKFKIPLRGRVKFVSACASGMRAQFMSITVSTNA